MPSKRRLLALRRRFVGSVLELKRCVNSSNTTRVRRKQRRPKPQLAACNTLATPRIYGKQLKAQPVLALSSYCVAGVGHVNAALPALKTAGSRDA